MPHQEPDASSVEDSKAAAEEPEKHVDAKTLKNQRKKLKKKLVAVGEAHETKVGEDVAEADADADKVKADPKAKAVNAKLAAKIQEREEALKLEKEKEAFIAAQLAKRADEDARMKKEQEEEETRRKAKTAAKQAKIAQQKVDGTYKTKKDREKDRANAARAAQLRAQFGFSVDYEEGNEVPHADAVKKRPKPAVKLRKKPAKIDIGDDDKGDQGDEVAVDAAAKPDDDDADAGDDRDVIADGGRATPEATADGDGGDDVPDHGGNDSDDDVVSYRSPVLAIMGHVDTGKTKLLDNIRRTNVQEGEAGGITQQIGATFFPDIALKEQTKKVDENFETKLPGLLIIDTPGHESFNNLRSRGSSLCDFAILVIDIMRGLEPQTVESLELLKKRKCPFLIAMNKIDRLYQFKCDPSELAVQKVLEQQQQNVKEEFRARFSRIQVQLAERGLNTALYWENDDNQRNISIVPTSAITGVGVPDLLYMAMDFPQALISESLEVDDEFECTVIEVKNMEGMGTTIDVVLKNGKLEVGDQIVVAGLGDPIVTTIRALLTPQPMKEMRVKGDYICHAKITTSSGIKIQAHGLEHAVAGSELLVVGPNDDIEELKEQILDSMREGTGTLVDFPKAEEGVHVKASTLGSLEALLAFLEEMKIPVFDASIGDITKKDVTKAGLMKAKSHPEYAVILAFDVKIRPDAKAQAEKDGIEVFLAEIIYHLEDKFTAYMKRFKEAKKVELKDEAVFPVILDIDKQCIIRQKNPMILGVTVIDGQLRIGTPLCVADKENILEIGRVTGIEIDRRPVENPRKGKKVCVKIEQNTAQQHVSYGRQFDHTSKLISCISRKSIDTVKEHFADEMTTGDWQLVRGLKRVLRIL